MKELETLPAAWEPESNSVLLIDNADLFAFSRENAGIGAGRVISELPDLLLKGVRVILTANSIVHLPRLITEKFGVSVFVQRDHPPSKAEYPAWCYLRLDAAKPMTHIYPYPDLPPVRSAMLHRFTMPPRIVHEAAKHFDRFPRLNGKETACPQES